MFLCFHVWGPTLGKNGEPNTPAIPILSFIYIWYLKYFYILPIFKNLISEYLCLHFLRLWGTRWGSNFWVQTWFHKWLLGLGPFGSSWYSFISLIWTIRPLSPVWLNGFATQVLSRGTSNGISLGDRLRSLWL